MYIKFFKRLFDIIFSSVALIVFSPIMLIVAVLVRIKLGTPVLFKQERSGKNEKIFTIYKFRTMTDARDENGELLPDEIRLTKFGKFLRSTSLDELPEFVNIFIGNMSMVGPRPLLSSYLTLYTDEQKRRHDALPGLTGLAQINGRNAITWDERLEYDVEYVDRVCFTGDVKIIFATIVKVLKRKDINAMGETGEGTIIVPKAAAGQSSAVSDH